MRSSLSLRMVYGLGEIPNAVKQVAFGLFTIYFYTTVVGLSATLVGIASSIGLLWDAIIDPYIGYASDSLESRIGRRHLPMFIGGATMGVSFWLFFSPPVNLGSTGLFLWLVLTGLLVRTATSLYAVPYSALGPDLSADYEERTTISGIRGFLALLGTLAAASLSFVLFFPDDNNFSDPKLNRLGYPLMGAVLGSAMTVFGLIAAIGTFSRREVRRPATSLPPGRFFAEIMNTFSNRSFRVLFTSFSLFFLAMVINASLSIHYLTHYVAVTASRSLSAFQAAFYIGGLAGVMVWLIVSRRLQKHHLYLVGSGGVLLLMIAAFGLVGPGRPFGTGNLRVMLVGHAIAGFFGSVLWFVPPSMIADIADEEELATGHRRDASFFGLFYFGQQIAAGVAILVTGVLLEWFAGLQPGGAPPSATTIGRLAILYSLFPATLVACAAAWMLRYSLSRSRLREIQSELGVRGRHQMRSD